MGASFSLAFLPGYLDAGAAGRVPNFVPRRSAALVAGGSPDGVEEERQAAFERELEAKGLPLVDNFAMMPLHRHADRVAEARALFDGLPAGLNYVILHPALDTPELRAISPEDWPARAADYAAFTSAELRSYVQRSGVHVIGWRVIRDAMRGQG